MTIENGSYQRGKVYVTHTCNINHEILIRANHRPLSHTCNINHEILIRQIIGP